MTKTLISRSTAKQLIRISRELVKSGELKPSWTSDDPNTHVLSERCFILTQREVKFGPVAVTLNQHRYFLIDDYNVPDSEEVRL